MITDHDSVTAVVTSEVCQISTLDTPEMASSAALIQLALILPDSYTVFTLPFNAGVNCPDA
mgnify:CR=1 FL=1